MSLPQETAAVAAVVVPEPAPIAAAPPTPLFDRELSWLAFNKRVLGEAGNPDVPLLERVKFLSICSNNLDEFFMIRVGEVRDLLAAKLSEAGPVVVLSEKLDEIRKRSRSLLEQMYRCLGEELIPLLKKEGIHGLILDLRTNPGGLLLSAVAAVALFQLRMEPLWSPVAATGGNQPQVD